MNNPLTAITDISFLPLDHPGAQDAAYRARRNEIARIAREFFEHLQTGTLPEIPTVTYTEEENQTWRTATGKLHVLHQNLASTRYLKAREKLPISTQTVPQLRDLNKELAKFHGFQVGPVEGLIDSRIFLGLLDQKLMLCTQYIRHASRPEYTPEPDIVHEVIGHVPMFTDPDVVEFSHLIGAAAQRSSSEQLLQLERLYWYTIEYGLIQEGKDAKAYGAGLLSSFGEIQHCFTDEVERVPFTLEEVLATPYDFSKMQSKLFVIPSFKALLQETQNFLNSI